MSEEPPVTNPITASLLIKRLAKDERRVKELGKVLKEKGIINQADIDRILAV